jgi:hypothetical protein
MVVLHEGCSALKANERDVPIGQTVFQVLGLCIAISSVVIAAVHIRRMKRRPKAARAEAGTTEGMNELA